MSSTTKHASIRGGALGGRAAARFAAVQALYQLAITETSPAAAVDEFLTHRLAPTMAEEGAEPAEGTQPDIAAMDREFFALLVGEVARHVEALDDMLSAVLAEGWPVERLETLLKLILRTGAYELAFLPEVPARVVISQYVDLAHAFLDDKQTDMVNGVLDRLAHSLRPEEFDGEALADERGG